MATTKSSPSPTVPTAPLVLMDVEELATYLKVERSFVYDRLRHRSSQEANPMPAHRMSGYWRFVKSEIDDWLLALPRTVSSRKRKYARRKAA